MSENMKTISLKGQQRQRQQHDSLPQPSNQRDKAWQWTHEIRLAEANIHCIIGPCPLLVPCSHCRRCPAHALCSTHAAVASITQSSSPPPQSPVLLYSPPVSDAFLQQTHVSIGRWICLQKETRRTTRGRSRHLRASLCSSLGLNTTADAAAALMR